MKKYNKASNVHRKITTRIQHLLSNIGSGRALGTVLFSISTSHQQSMVLIFLKTRETHCSALGQYHLLGKAFSRQYYGICCLLSVIPTLHSPPAKC